VLKISDALKDLIEENATLHFGFHHRLLNLSQTARFLRAAVEARVKKPVTDTALLMNLSRLQRQLAPRPDPPPAFSLDGISARSGLCALSLTKSPRTHRELNKIFAEVQKREGFITLTEGVAEITAIMDEDSLATVRAMLSDKPRLAQRGLGSVTVKFHPRYITVKGLLYLLLQQAALQNINVVEVASTATEFTIYVAEADVQLTFDSIYRRFARRKRRPLHSSQD